MDLAFYDIYNKKKQKAKTVVPMEFKVTVNYAAGEEANLFVLEKTVRRTVNKSL